VNHSTPQSNCEHFDTCGINQNLLLDTAQICQIAGDVQCVMQQNQSKTLNQQAKFKAGYK
jgi:hypothetical protein